MSDISESLSHEEAEKLVKLGKAEYSHYGSPENNKFFLRILDKDVVYRRGARYYLLPKFPEKTSTP